MLIPWVLLLVALTAGQEVYESTEDRTLNITTLYPVANKTTNNNENYRNHTETEKKIIKTDFIEESNDNENRNDRDKVDATTSKKERVTTWAIDASYAQPQDKQSQAILAKPKETESLCDQRMDKKNEDSNSTDSKEQSSVEKPKSNSEEKKFIPSPHLGSFFDDENLNLLKFSSPEPFAFPGKKPGVDFLGSKDFHVLNYKSPKNTNREQLAPPYRFEGAPFLTTNNWKQTLESKPTVESSVKIPAGGLYKHSNPFKEKPNSGAEDDDFGIGFNEDGREKPVKKRSNPWKNLVQLVTAFLPVGLIISALTPSIITLHSADNDPYLSRLSRRADGGLANVPAISERCRRRLLCEIHSEENYVRPHDRSRYARKHCYKLLCEDPQALSRVLGWLLAHRPAAAHHSRDRSDVMNYHHRSNDYT